MIIYAIELCIIMLQSQVITNNGAAN